MPWEAAAPFVLITGAIFAMGQILDVSERLSYGRPKTTGLDQWDRGLQERDHRFAKSWDTWLKDHAVRGTNFPVDSAASVRIASPTAFSF